MVATVAGIHLGIDTHANRPAANTVPDGSIYSCSTHSLVYKSNYAGNSWATWATLSGGLADQGSFTYLDATEAAAPATPATGKVRLYAKADGLLYSKDDAGAETALGGGGGAPTTAKYITTATDGTLSAEIVIPGLAGSPDKRAGGASDDEFDTTDTTDPITGWTTLGTLDGLNTNSTVLSHLYLKKNATASTRVDGIYKAMSPAFTITAKLTASTIRADFARAGIFVGAATPGDIETCGIVHATTQSAFQGEVLDMTNPTTFNATVASTGVFPTTNGSAGRGQQWYFQIIVASSTDVTYKISYDGIFWIAIVSNRNPGFTIGSAGLFLNPQNASNDVEAVFDWVRFT